MNNEDFTRRSAPAASATTDEPATVPESAAEADTVDDSVLLVDWCAQESGKTRRISLLSAFHHAENKAGRLRDTAANFKQRFDAFTAKAVK